MCAHVCLQGSADGCPPPFHQGWPCSPGVRSDRTHAFSRTVWTARPLGLPPKYVGPLSLIPTATKPASSRPSAPRRLCRGDRLKQPGQFSSAANPEQEARHRVKQLFCKRHHASASWWDWWSPLESGAHWVSAQQSHSLCRPQSPGWTGRQQACQTAAAPRPPGAAHRPSGATEGRAPWPQRPAWPAAPGRSGTCWSV